MTQARVNGKFLTVGGERYLIRGVSYGTFAPDADGVQFPSADRISLDFSLMAAAGINTVRTYTPPPGHLLDEAARHGLRVMIGLPWSQHIAFLDDRDLTRQIRRDTAQFVRTFGTHPAALLFAVGNEIPPAVVRWHGAPRVEEFLRAICADAKAASPDSLLTYVNYPPTEYLDTECFDVTSFNVYLHREADLRAYLARLQQVAGNKPLLLAEAGGDSIREGLAEQARITSMHIRAAFTEGLCGAVAFSWTDEWWRGGHEVHDWAFGLVDRDRQPKPALDAVSRAFAEAPFAAAERAAWPKVSVVVCAYNAADTLDDCLASLRKLEYPDYEVLLINDGSRDRTGEIAERYAEETRLAGGNGAVRVITIPNGGLSAARNVGLAEAKGEIVAYTDADVRVEADWLMYLVQPFLTSDVVGSGGPNVIPSDDPWVAQCVARSPGGPTHVLLDDRIAEHVPGCNMAFRRDALLAIGGFNPVYLRAGDDVDVCWRLQAKGQQIGFAPSALVWHHHRPSVKAYWRQQVGYGEGETWLDAHHPEKFVRGNMLWRGRIYSSLPFVRSLSGRRINTGVWGTAAFPSVYRTDVHGFQFLPHLPAWWFTSIALCLLGLGTLLTPFRGLAAVFLLLGVLGWLTTIVRCLVFGWTSDLSGVTTARSRTALLRHRLLIAWMHFIQPIARFYGRIRGMLNPPTVIESGRVTRFPWKAPGPSLSDVAATAALLVGVGTEERYWGERWTTHDEVLSELAGLLRSARPARSVDIDDGWRVDRDVSVGVGRWGWLDARVLLEEHGGSKVLFRVGTKLRPTLKGIALAMTLAVSAVAATSAAIFFKWPWLSVPTAAFVAVVFTRAAWATTRAATVMRRAVERATAASGMVRIPVRPQSTRSRRLRPYPIAVSQIVQTVVALALTGSAVLTGSSVVSDIMTIAARRPVPLAVTNLTREYDDISGSLAVAPNGDLFFADGRQGVIRQFDTRPYEQSQRSKPTAARARQFASLQFASPSDVAVSANGDIYVADAQNDRICRIDRANGKIVTVAGSGVAGFDGDLKQATQAALHGPNAVAVARNGDLYIADTNNNRVRVVEQATGIIRTIAGDGIGGSGALIGDGGLATHAHLDHPTDVALAPNGDVYIADMGHHRIRMIDARTGIITTVAGDGIDAMRGDGGPALAASLSGPAGVAVVPVGRRVVIYIADYRNDRVRMVGTDGLISTVLEKFPSPSRVAMRPGGWLYVANDRSVTAVNVNRLPYQLATVPPPRPSTEPLRTEPPTIPLRPTPSVVVARKVT